MKTVTVVAFSVVSLTTAVLAHEGVQNPTVLARMQAMSQIADDTKLLGRMAKGELGFDADLARGAAARIAESAKATPKLFERPENDPKSEALPIIWEDFDEFASIADDLHFVAQEASMSLTSLEDLRTALAEIGGTCRSCHSDYRE